MALGLRKHIFIFARDNFSLNNNKKVIKIKFLILKFIKLSKVTYVRNTSSIPGGMALLLI
jgi:hypothetical protein